jgi:hypothetical protein
MAAQDKQAFQLKANFNSVEIAVDRIVRGDTRETRLIRVGEGDTYETTDPDEIRELERHPAVKAAEAPAKASAKKADS